MTLQRIRFRDWWQPPKRLIDREGARQVTFFELFYDLVYVVLIAELAHALSGHIDLTGLLGYAFLFVVVWWAWLNGTLYHDLHGNKVTYPLSPGRTSALEKGSSTTQACARASGRVVMGTSLPSSSAQSPTVQTTVPS